MGDMVLCGWVDGSDDYYTCGLCYMLYYVQVSEEGRINKWMDIRFLRSECVVITEICYLLLQINLFSITMLLLIIIIRVGAREWLVDW